MKWFYVALALAPLAMSHISSAKSLDIPESQLGRCITVPAEPHLHVVNALGFQGAICPIAKGEIVQLRLPITPGTGYQWFLVGPKVAVEQVGEGSLIPLSHPVPGATETEILTFRLVKDGTFRLLFGYSRDLPTYSKTFVLFVKVSHK